uniref:Cilia-and flagella-associated protein 100 isoform X1 n=1 Tax=Sus scrofa TaxID=9823 RepID=A0A480GIF6_PIG
MPCAHHHPQAAIHPSVQGPYLLITLVLAKMEDAGFELQLGGRLLLLGNGHHQCGDPLLQLVDLPVHADLGVFQGEAQLLQGLLHFLGVLDQREVLLFQLHEDIQELLGLREVQLQLLPVAVWVLLHWEGRAGPAESRGQGTHGGPRAVSSSPTPCPLLCPSGQGTGTNLCSAPLPSHGSGRRVSTSISSSFSLRIKLCLLPGACGPPAPRLLCSCPPALSRYQHPLRTCAPAAPICHSFSKCHLLSDLALVALVPDGPTHSCCDTHATSNGP